MCSWSFIFDKQTFSWGCISFILFAGQQNWTFYLYLKCTGERMAVIKLGQFLLPCLYFFILVDVICTSRLQLSEFIFYIKFYSMTNFLPVLLMRALKVSWFSKYNFLGPIRICSLHVPHFGLRNLKNNSFTLPCSSFFTLNFLLSHFFLLCSRMFAYI